MSQMLRFRSRRRQALSGSREFGNGLVAFLLLTFSPIAIYSIPVEEVVLTNRAVYRIQYDEPRIIIPRNAVTDIPISVLPSTLGVDFIFSQTVPGATSSVVQPTGNVRILRITDLTTAGDESISPDGLTTKAMLPDGHPAVTPEDSAIAIETILAEKVIEAIDGASNKVETALDDWEGTACNFLAGIGADKVRSEFNKRSSDPLSDDTVASLRETMILGSHLECGKVRAELESRHRQAILSIPTAQKEQLVKRGASLNTSVSVGFEIFDQEQSVTFNGPGGIISTAILLDFATSSPINARASEFGFNTQSLSIQTSGTTGDPLSVDFSLRGNFDWEYYNDWGSVKFDNVQVNFSWRF